MPQMLLDQQHLIALDSLFDALEIMQRSDRATEETIAVDHRRDVRLLVPLSWLPDLICRRSEPLPQP